MACQGMKIILNLILLFIWFPGFPGIPGITSLKFPFPSLPVAICEFPFPSRKTGMWFSISLPVPGSQKAFPAHPCNWGLGNEKLNLQIAISVAKLHQIQPQDFPLCRARRSFAWSGTTFRKTFCLASKNWGGRRSSPMSPWHVKMENRWRRTKLSWHHSVHFLRTFSNQTSTSTPWSIWGGWSLRSCIQY